MDRRGLPASTSLSHAAPLRGHGRPRGRVRATSTCAWSPSVSRRPASQADYGMYASLTPLRFAGGQPAHRPPRAEVDDPAGRSRAAARCSTCSTSTCRGSSICRLARSFTTIAHELWHIGPQFDGDLRRFGGRCYAHSRSQRQFDAQVKQLVERWLERRPAGMFDEVLSLRVRS